MWLTDDSIESKTKNKRLVIIHVKSVRKPDKFATRPSSSSFDVVLGKIDWTDTERLERSRGMPGNGVAESGGFSVKKEISLGELLTGGGSLCACVTRTKVHCA